MTQFGFKQSIASLGPACILSRSRNTVTLFVSGGITVVFPVLLNPDRVQLCWNIINTRKQTECDKVLSFLVPQIILLQGCAPSVENNRNVNWTGTQKGMYLSDTQRVRAEFQCLLAYESKSSNDGIENCWSSRTTWFHLHTESQKQHHGNAESNAS